MTTQRSTLQAICTDLNTFREYWDTNAFVSAEEFAARGPLAIAEDILAHSEADEWTDADRAYVEGLRAELAASLHTYELIEAGHYFASVKAASAAAALDNVNPEWSDYAGQDPDDTTRTTVYTAITARNIDDEDDTETRTFALPPDEPPCTADAHEWSDDHDLVGGLPENPGVWGHGGGVRIHTACVHCGCGKIVDTWASHPLTGEQGLTATTYEPDTYTAQLAARQANDQEA